MRFSHRADRGVAIDLGSGAVRISVPGVDVVDEPTVLVRDRRGRAVAVGTEALRMVGRGPDTVEVVRPVVDGVVVDLPACQQLLRLLLGRLRGRRRRDTTVVSVPTGATSLERRALRQPLQAAGVAGPIVLLESTLAAAIGSGLPVEEPFGSMVVDVGRGVTEAAVISLGAIVSARTTRVGGSAVDAAIVRHLRERHGLAVGEVTAERIKTTLGAAHRIDVRAVDVAIGLPRVLSFEPDELRAAYEESLAAIVATVTGALDSAPPELAADVVDGGITLTGGSSHLDGLAHRIAVATGVPVHMAADGPRAVIDGARQCVAVVSRALPRRRPLPGTSGDRAVPPPRRPPRCRAGSPRPGRPPG